MKKLILLLVILFKTILFISGAYCANWHVSIDGDDTMGDGSPAAPFATIQRAVNASAHMDSIALVDGIHSGGVSITNESLTFYSLSGNCMACRINGEGANGISYTGESILSSYSSLRFENIYFFNAEIGVRVFALRFYHYDVGNVELTGCHFDGCTTGLYTGDCIAYLKDCTFVGNSSSGVYADGGMVKAENCFFNSNETGIVQLEEEFTELARSTFTQTVFVANGLGLKGKFYGHADFAECRFDSNQVGMSVSSQVYNSGAEHGITLENCLIRDNTQDGIQLDRTGALSILDQTEISGNGRHGIFDLESTQNFSVLLRNAQVVSNGGHGIFLGNRESLSFILRSSIVAQNGGDGIRWAPWAEGRYFRIYDSTIVGNSGNGLYVAAGNRALSNSLIVENGGLGIQLEEGPETSVECTDIFSNTGGDWVDSLAGMEYQNGNLWEDPQFCSFSDGDYTLIDISPCLPGNHPQGYDCGQIGALSQGCQSEIPRVISLLDVPNDQGGRIRLTWSASPLDLAPGSPSVSSYDLARKIPESPDWEILETRSAEGAEFYEAFLPTLGDSSDTWTEFNRVFSTYRVVARTGDPSIFFSSFPDSGYSVDNLAPDAPTDFVVIYDEDAGYWLSWHQGSTPDLREFRIFRGMGENPVTFSLVAFTDQVQFHHQESTPGMVYQVAAVDQAGNQSPVSGALGPPRASLVGVYPNPANSVVTIAFELSKKASVSMAVFDLKGQLVKKLVQGEERIAGRYELTWSGVDSKGRRVPSGKYICRFQVDGVLETRGITLAR